MNISADKASANQSQAVANIPSQGVGEQAFHLTDNRPESASYQKLKDLAGNSQQVKQLAVWKAVMQGTATPLATGAGRVQAIYKQGSAKPPLQLKSGEYISDDATLQQEPDKMEQPGGRMDAIVQRVLSKSVLNVAGEDHDETGPREDEEKKFSREKTGVDNYWEEAQFPATGGGAADSPQLRFNFELAAIKHQFGELERINSLGAETKEIVESLEKSIGMEILSIVDDAEGALDEDYGKYKVHLGKLLDEIRNADLEKIKEHGAAFVKSASHIKPVSDASTDRGRAMHNAAQDRFETKGVWKIGDAHVRQIRTIMAGHLDAIKYNLTDRAAFNAEYTAWKSTQVAAPSALKTLEDAVAKVQQEMVKGVFTDSKTTKAIFKALKKNILEIQTLEEDADKSAKNSLLAIKFSEYKDVVDELDGVIEDYLDDGGQKNITKANDCRGRFLKIYGSAAESKTASAGKTSAASSGAPRARIRKPAVHVNPALEVKEEGPPRSPAAVSTTSTRSDAVTSSVAIPASPLKSESVPPPPPLVREVESEVPPPPPPEKEDIPPPPPAMKEDIPPPPSGPPPD